MEIIYTNSEAQNMFSLISYIFLRGTQAPWDGLKEYVQKIKSNSANTNEGHKNKPLRRGGSFSEKQAEWILPHRSTKTCCLLPQSAENQPAWEVPVRSHPLLCKFMLQNQGGLSPF